MYSNYQSFLLQLVFWMSCLRSSPVSQQQDIVLYYCPELFGLFFSIQIYNHPRKKFNVCEIEVIFCYLSPKIRVFILGSLFHCASVYRCTKTRVLNHCCIVLSLNIWDSKFFLFFSSFLKIILAILGPFNINFRISLPYPAKMHTWDIDQNYIKFNDRFGEK